MVVGVGGIGNFRDLGDPNDPRRGTSAPQGNSTPGLPDPIEILIELQRHDTSSTADTPIPRPSQTPPASPTNTEYVDRSTGVQRGFGAGGGAQIDSPLSAQGIKEGEERWIATQNGQEQVGPSEPRRVYNSAARIARRNPEGGSVSWDRGSETSRGVEVVLTELEKELAKFGIPIDENDAQLFAEYTGGRRPSEFVEDTRVVQTQDYEKQDGFSNISESDLDDRYKGYRTVPNSTGTEISPFYTVEVPTRDRTGQVTGTKRIDPRAVYRTDQADSETLRNAKHASEEEVRTSNANFASQVQKENRTPLITTDTFNEGLKNGTIVQVSARDRSHIADHIGPNGERTPIFSTKIRDDSEVRAPMYRVGVATNIDNDAARDQLNPRDKEVYSDFDTQVVRTGAVVKRDAAGNPIADPRTGKLARTQGRAVETGPVPFLNREDLMPTLPGLRKNVEKELSTRSANGRGHDFSHLPEGTQARIEQALAGRELGGTREERIAADTASPFVQTNAAGDTFVRTNDLASPVEGLEGSIASLDQALRELAGGGYMSDPSVADGYQRMAIEIEAGRMPAAAVPERARPEVARYQAMIRANSAPVERVPIQTAPMITEVVLDNEADLVAEEINGPARNFDGEGRVVQGSYGDFGEQNPDEAWAGGYGTKDAPDLTYSPEFQAAKRAVDEQLAFSNRWDQTITPENEAKLNQLAGAVLADAVATTPAPMVSADNKEFQAALRSSTAKLGGQSVDVLQGRSMVIPTANEQAVREEGSAIPQSRQDGIVNTTSVSQINAPAPQQSVEVNPEVARLLPYVGKGVRQSQLDLIEKGLPMEEGTPTRTAADDLVARFRRQFR